MRALCALIALGSMTGGCRSLRPPNHVESRYEGPIQSRDVERGEDIFLTICTVCHAGRVNPRGYHWRPGQMRRQIREGNRFMPPIPANRISEEDLEAVLAFLSTIEAIDGELPPLRRIPDGWIEASPDFWVRPRPAADTAASEEPEQDVPATDAGEETTPSMELEASPGDVEDGSVTSTEEPPADERPPAGAPSPEVGGPAEIEESPALGRALDSP